MKQRPLIATSEIGGHACPRLVRPVSVSAIFGKIHVRVRGLKNFHVRVRVRVRGLKTFHVRVRVRDFKISHVRVRDFKISHVRVRDFPQPW